MYRVMSFMLLVPLYLLCAAAPETAPTPEISLHGGRRVFQRMEPAATVSLLLRNPLDVPLRSVTVTLLLGGAPAGQVHMAAEVPPQSEQPLTVGLDTTLRASSYAVTLRLNARAGEHPVEISLDSPETLIITPRFRPQVFPVIDWTDDSIERLTDVGFTHAMLRRLTPDYQAVWQADEPLATTPPGRLQRALDDLDLRLAHGIRCFAALRPAHYPMSAEPLVQRYRRIDRNGTPHRRANVCGLSPEIQAFCRRVGISTALAYGNHPAMVGARIHDELRDGTAPCFHAHDRDAYRDACGQEIPDVVSAKSGITPEEAVRRLPPTGLVPDNDPILSFYRWFWKAGDGWNDLNSQVHDGLMSVIQRPDFWTFHDPAVRVPPLWGSGGKVTVLSHWTYTYPDPVRMGLATDELFAMADGNPGQEVMKMTQVLWYRDQVAPRSAEPPESQAEWEKSEPEARFITCAPDSLREGFWLKIARPVKGIMYYGSGCLFGGGQQQRMTNARTRDVLRELIREVVVPLGPTLLQLPDAPGEVAMLESVTSMVFGGQATWGWARGWPGEVYHILQWARLQPRVVYEETIVRDKLAGIRVLVLPACSALPDSVVQAIREFQQRGGVVVADPWLAAALIPDIMLQPVQRSTHTPPDQFKTTLQKAAADLRDALAPVYEPHADSSTSDVIVRRRRYGDTDYLVAINDHRTFGTYVGHHRKVMEMGLPQDAVIRIRRQGVRVYDLLQSRALPTRTTPSGTSWDVSLPAGGGGLYMISERPLGGIGIAIEPRPAGQPQVHLRVRVTDPAGTPLSAIVPILVQISDPNGNEAEFSGHYGAKDGIQDLTLTLAANDARGTWTIAARELAAGNSTQQTFEYR